MQNVIVFGAGGNSFDIIDAINSSHIFRCIGILDDAPSLRGKIIYGVQVLGELKTATQYNNCLFVNGIHSLAHHKIKDAVIAQSGCDISRFATIIHPTAYISPSANIAPGCVVLANSTVCANTQLGKHSIILSGSVINHDVNIGNYSTITSCVGVSGSVMIGSFCYVGTGAKIREHVIIGDRAFVAMGAVVTHNIAKDSKVAGCPAKAMKPK